MNRENTTQLPTIEDALVRRVGPNDDLVAIFCEQARNVGLNVTESSSETAVADVANLIQSIQPEGNAGKPKVIIEPPLLLREQIEVALGGDAELLNSRDGDDAMFSADVGVTSVHAAIAETGSLVCASGEELWRGLSLILPAHIAIVRESQIVPDLIDFFANLPNAELPANLTLISGPSKTADIEGILITGVHGPGEVHVVVIREPTGGDNPNI